MKFFVDTADIAEITRLAETGFVDGVTTNPSLIAKTGRDMLEVVREICAAVDGPVSAEVTATDHQTMLKEGFRLAELADPIIELMAPGARLVLAGLLDTQVDGLVSAYAPRVALSVFAQRDEWVCLSGIRAT